MHASRTPTILPVNLSRCIGTPHARAATGGYRPHVTRGVELVQTQGRRQVWFSLAMAGLLAAGGARTALADRKGSGGEMDQEFSGMATQSNALEILLGDLAQQRATN